MKGVNRRKTATVSILTYLSFSFESTVDDLLELLDLVAAYAAKLVPKFTVFINKCLNDIHLLIQLIEFGIGQRLRI